MSAPRRSVAVAAVASVVVFGLLGIELFARVWVGLRWPAQKLKVYTEVTTTKGRLTADPVLPYVLTPDWVSDDEKFHHDGRGFRFSGASTSTVVLACIGASTTYGIYVGDDETHCAKLGALLGQRAVNAGVPGWVTSEMLAGYERVAPLRPSVVVVYAGRNDLFPQSYDDFREDYAHYRDARYDFRASNRTAKRLFSLSHAALLVGYRSWWDARAEHPIYGSVRLENMPNVDSLINNLDRAEITQAYANNLRKIAHRARGDGARVVFATMAFIPDRLATNNYAAIDRRMFIPLGKQLERNNDVMRAVAREVGAVLVDTAGLARQAELFLDDCHMTAEGHAERARVIAGGLR